MFVNERGGAGPDRRGRARPAQCRGPGIDLLEELARVDWIEKSDVAALREGVIQKMELQIGMPVKKGGTIGVLHRELAELTVGKTSCRPIVVAPTEKAEAQKDVAASVVARNKRLNERKPGMVSAEDVAKAEGELKVADAAGPRSQRKPAVSPRPISTWRSRPRRSTRSSPPSMASSSSG